ncbi:MAG: hypothetical protein K5695_15550 [Oscillospiraceae bacterium]|nr:hypothetical protein [Oscillospiraceae bacterium]
MKIELTKRLFTACILVFILSIFMVMIVVGNYLARRNLEEVKDMAIHVSAILDTQGWDLLPQADQNSPTRMTIIAPDGSVLYDSNFPANTLENHGDREEFLDALRNGEGESSRYSKSLLQKTVNYAIRLRDGNVVRISMVQDTVWMLLANMLNPMMLIVLVAVLISVLLASRFSRKIMEPINRMDVENPDDRDIYDEMKPFVHRLVSQNQQIHRQMEAIKEEHAKQDTMRREFTANVSHELKTPLTSISGFAEIIRDGMVQEKDIPHFADTIYKEAARLMDLVNDILRLSRLEDIDQRPEKDMVPIQLQETAAVVMKRLALPAEQKEIRIEYEGDPVEIRGVPNIIEEVVYNVCDNAIKYGKTGGSVRITTGIENGRGFLKVKDDGIGIPLADQSRVFERFYRVNKSHSKEVGGTGLGLSIVKHAMLQHGGEVTLDSTLGTGTEIGLWFPVLDTNENTAESEESP